MRSLEEIQRDYDRVSAELNVLQDIHSYIGASLTNAWNSIEALNNEIDTHPDADQEVHATRREPEDKVWSAMQGGTNGG